MTSPTAPREGKRQCTATSKRTHQRCGATPPPGFTVCKWHGGKAPQVQKSARAYLAEQIMPSITRLATERDKAPKASDRIRAATNLLDRGGFGPRVTVELDDARSLLIERLREMRATALRPALPAAEEDVVYAQVIEEGDEEDTPDGIDRDPIREGREHGDANEGRYRDPGAID